MFGETDEENSAEEADNDGFDSDLDLDRIQGQLNEESGSESEEDSDVSSVEEESWTDQLENVMLNDFEGDPGVKVPVPNDAKEIDFFSFLFGDSEIDILVRETNRFARQKLANMPPRLALWKDATLQEMKAYIGMWIVMGINVLPEIAMYWSNDSFIGNDGIKAVMTKNRFEELAQYLHFNDSTQEPPRGDVNHDRLYKIRPILSNVLRNIQASYYPGKNISIDEGMVAFKGRLGFRQYMPAKPTKYGIKVWMAADAESAYVVNFSVYLGSEENGAPRIHGLGYETVMKMARPYLNKYHHLFFDNYFSGMRLFEHLLMQNTYACATVRPNRKDLPLCAKAKLKEPGDLKVRQKGENILFTKWHDKRDVSFLSSNVSPDEPNREVERMVKGKRITIVKPYVSDLYTSKMGGVDRADQLRSSYTVGRPCKKWYRYLFWYALNLAICNARVLENVHKRPATPKRQLDFRLALSKQLIGNFTQRKRASTGPIPALNEAARSHKSVKLEKRKKECVQCKKDGKKTPRGRPIETKHKCKECDIALCQDPCFARYHFPN
ncbi:hypothetical protein QZH41_002045 [Actinostola sp. cb2023]|nr:hypothetical protein QZH41_002045 [Actinostola sp. cb2023]